MKKQKFKSPFIGIENHAAENGEDIPVLYSNDGAMSVILKIDNLATEYCANEDYYRFYHYVFGQIVKLLGDGFIIQKTDIISQAEYKGSAQNNKEDDYLTTKYFNFFNGRTYKGINTYLTLTKEATKQSNLFSANGGSTSKAFLLKVNKVLDTISNNNLSCLVLNKGEIKRLFQRFEAFNFGGGTFSLCNIESDENSLYFDDLEVKSISVIDLDEMNLPNDIGSYSFSQELGDNFPVDNLDFLTKIPAQTLVYNQIIKIPNQRKIKNDLEVKNKRLQGIPDANNQLSIQDIDSMFVDIAQNNELLVYCHFNIMVADHSEHIEKAINAVENNLFTIGIIPGKNNYNQMELYRAAIPGNASELKAYDLFLTSRPASICFFFKEALPLSDDSDYQLFFTDRQGIPLGVDTSELPMQTGRISNRNRFILGPSGSGKSFFTNSYLKQCYELGADVVIVDTGNSYSGLSKYVGGKYITYTEENPITMNPFKIKEVENNEEKRQMVKELIGLIWKGADGHLTQVEDDVISKCVSHYYGAFFKKAGAWEKEITSLSFNSFYEFSCEAIDRIREEEHISFDLDEYKFILKKFYKGGIYDTILNDEFDSTLFDEEFIVFEIDNIKEHKLLFPITTLIIMDVFIQKMRHKSNKKILTIEEAWKAIASPMMASYILYLYKTCRKFGGEAIVVTQELNDIIGNEIVKDSILSNSDTICLLDQTKFKDTFDDIAKLLALNNVEQRKIFTINKLDNKQGRNKFKEVYIKRGAIGEVYGVEVPLEEYLSYTTERSEKEAMEVYFEYYDTYQKAMDSFIGDMESSGLNLPQFVKAVNRKQTLFSV